MFGLAAIGPALHPQELHRRRRESLRCLWKEPGQNKARHLGNTGHHRRGQAQPWARAFGDLLVDPHELIDREKLTAEDVLLPGAPALHSQDVSLDDIARSHKLEPAR